jgi:hypothetical protein
MTRFVCRQATNLYEAFRTLLVLRFSLLYIHRTNITPANRINNINEQTRYCIQEHAKAPTD